MRPEEAHELHERVYLPAYPRRQFVAARGKGSRLWDSEGREYVDLVAGVAVNALGHCHPAIVEAIREQAGSLVHASNLYYTVPQARLAERLSGACHGMKVFFTNSGAEANEGALKAVRRYGAVVEQAAAAEAGEARPPRCNVVCFEGSFHGRTFETMCATGQPRHHAGNEPLATWYSFARLNDRESVESALDERTVAVLVEPIQGEGGNNVASDDFMRWLRDFCDEKGLFLLLDEIQCGLGRTGRLFAHEHYGIVPDAGTLAKPLGGGLPLGAFLVSEKLAGAFAPGAHGTTFGGNPVACAAGLAFLDVMEKENLLAHVTKMGKRLGKLLDGLCRRSPHVVEARGRGLMMGVELDFPGAPVVTACMNRGVLLNCTAGNFIRFLPPLNVAPEDLEKGVAVLEEAVKECAG